VTDTHDGDEAAYLRREQARWRFFLKIEFLQQQQEQQRASEKPADAPSAEPVSETG
jgi:hypothetical protein